MNQETRGLLLGLAVVFVPVMFISLLIIRWYRLPHHSRWPVRLFIWPLAALGAYILIGLGAQRIKHGELGLGVAFIVYLVWAALISLYDHVTAPQPDSSAPAPSSRRPT